jgi:glycosyltransferase involved in cell wall biosynthesis
VSAVRSVPLKIVHVVSYVSADGAFGGPVAVAVGQATELARTGHTVKLFAGWDGVQSLDLSPVLVRLSRVRRLGPGFGGMVSPKLWMDILRAAKHVDVYHVHMGRDPLSLISAVLAHLSGRPYVLQTHGMVLPRRSIVIRLLDLILTRPVLNKARRVLVLTEAEASAISTVSRGRAKVEIIANGIACRPQPQGTRDERSLLFLARLHPRKRVLAFAEMCRLLRDGDTRFRAYIVGPDEGDLAVLNEYIKKFNLSEYVSYKGAVGPGESFKWLAASGIFVLPSVGEVFPMTVLEALSSGTPVITTADSGLARKLLAFGAAIVTDGSPEAMAAGVERIFHEPEFRRSLRTGGLSAVNSELSITAVAGKLESIYQS